MKSRFASVVPALLTLALALGAVDLHATVPALLDDFSDAAVSSLGTPRLTITDAQLGGGSRAESTFEAGVLHLAGEIRPARGQPGFVSFVILLAPNGQPQDLSAYEGVRLRMRATQGNFSVVVASAAIDNFDYHATTVQRRPGDLVELRIPFSELRRVWSAQTPLDLTTITSVNLVASGLQPGAFAAQVDEIGFY